MLIPIELLDEIIMVFHEEDLYNWGINTSEDCLEFYYYHKVLGYTDTNAKIVVDRLTRYFTGTQMVFTNLGITAAYNCADLIDVFRSAIIIKTTRKEE